MSPARRQVLLGAGVFGLTVLGIIVAEILLGVVPGFTTAYSISRYVGQTPITALVFLACNIFLAVQFVKIFRGIADQRMEKHLPFKELPWLEKIRFVIGWIIAIFLVVLSVCPIGLFDPNPEELSAVSIIHQISSRTMFALMGAYSISLCISERKNKRIFWANLIFSIYFLAVLFICAVFWDFFWANSFIFESVFIYGFLLALYHTVI